MALEGVRVGPLDPDRTENFGQVSGRTSARQLIRHHLALHPPQLVSALSRARQHERSEELRRDEVQALAEQQIRDAESTVPEGFKITGAAVHGDEDVPEQQVVTYTFRVESGRTGKGFIVGDPRELLPESWAAGDEALAINDAKKRGLPWLPKQAADSLRAQLTSDDDPAGDPDEHVGLADENDALQTENEELREQLEDIRRRLAEVEGQQPTAEQEQPPSPQNPEGGSADLQGEAEEAAEPWEGYEGANADDIRKRLREAPADEKVTLAQRVLAYEEANQKRGTVLAQANSILDRTPAQ